MTLLEEIFAKCPMELITAKEHGLIAAKLNEGRVGPSHFLLGKGDVINLIGFDAGNTALDAVENGVLFRHVKHLLTEGKLDTSLPLFSGALNGLVDGGYLSRDNANILLALGTQPITVSVQDIINAMKGV